MLKSKKGFTLVELLAVIVVLAIIALIGYTIVGDVISNVQESADKENVREYARSVRLAITSAQMNGETIPSPLDNSWLSTKVEKTGNEVKCSSVKDINGTIKLSGCIVGNSNNKYCYDGENVTICNINNIITGIYGNSTQNGTPSPTSPVEIQSVGDKTVNLFNPNLNFTTATLNGITIEYLEDEDCYLINGTATSTTMYADRYINLPITNGSYFSISTKYVSGTVTRPNASDYALVYFGAANAISTSNN